MQPYFFPALGYFDLMRTTDRWILFDTVQYRRHSWLNRNRILHPASGWQYVSAPLKKHHRDTLIRDVEVREGDEWKRRIVGQLAHYKKRAPYYARTVEWVEDALDTDTLPGSPAESIEDDASAFLVDLDAENGSPAKRHPARVVFKTEGGDYIGDNHLLVTPVLGFPLYPDHTYAAVVTDAIRSADGKRVVPGVDFEQTLHEEPAFGPLLNWLGADGAPAAEDVVTASVFTVGNPAATVFRAREVILRDIEPPTPVSMDPEDPTDDYVEFRG